MEIWQRRLDEYTTILAAISLSNLSFASAELFGSLSDSLTTVSRNISEILNTQNQEKEERHVGSHLSSGGRPAYDICRETGMNWRSIAVCLGVSEQTLYRRRIHYGIDNNFTDITEEELDDQIKLTLNLTPYSGEPADAVDVLALPKTPATSLFIFVGDWLRFWFSIWPRSPTF